MRNIDISCLRYSKYNNIAYTILRMNYVTQTRKRLILLTSFCNILISLGLGRFLFSLIVPFLHSFYTFSFTQIGTLSSLILLGYLVFSYLGGVFSYRYGYRTVTIISVFTLSSAFFIYYISKNFYLLCFSSFLMGCASATIYINIFPIVHDNFDFGSYGKSMGIILSGAGFGIFGISSIAAFLLEDTSIIFRVWAIAAFLTLLMIPVNSFILRTVDSGVGSKINIGKIGFYKKAWKDLFYNPSFRDITLAYFFYGFSYSSYILAYAAESSLNGSSSHIWMIFGFTSILSAFFWGRLADNNRLNLAAIGNYILTGIALFIAIAFSRVIFLYISSSLFGFCFFGYITLIGVIIIKATKELSSVYMGKITLIHTIGQILGAFGGGFFRDQTSSFRPIFALSFLSLLFSLFVFLMFLSHAKKKDHIV